MAVDTAQKRFSATMLLTPGYTPGVVPAGTVGQALRQAVSWLYGGILAQTVVAEVVGLAQISFTGKAPSVSFADKSPAVAFTGKAPSISFTGVS